MKSAIRGWNGSRSRGEREAVSAGAQVGNDSEALSGCAPGTAVAIEATAVGAVARHLAEAAFHVLSRPQEYRDPTSSVGWTREA